MLPFKVVDNNFYMKTQETYCVLLIMATFHEDNMTFDRHEEYVVKSDIDLAKDMLFEGN